MGAFAVSRIARDVRSASAYCGTLPQYGKAPCAETEWILDTCQPIDATIPFSEPSSEGYQRRPEANSINLKTGVEDQMTEASKLSVTGASKATHRERLAGYRSLWPKEAHRPELRAR